jgi:hypothetical protein
MTVVISSAPKARIVPERILPRDPTGSRHAVPVSSSGKSATLTRSYSPTVQSSSRSRPPEFSASLVKSAAAGRVLVVLEALIGPVDQRYVCRHARNPPLGACNDQIILYPVNAEVKTHAMPTLPVKGRRHSGGFPIGGATADNHASRGQRAGRAGNLSQFSHKLTGRYWTAASTPDTRQHADLRVRILAH